VTTGGAQPGAALPTKGLQGQSQQRILAHCLTEVELLFIIDGESTLFLRPRQGGPGREVHCGQKLFLYLEDQGLVEGAKAAATHRFDPGVQDAGNQNAPLGADQADLSLKGEICLILGITTVAKTVVACGTYSLLKLLKNVNYHRISVAMKRLFIIGIVLPLVKPKTSPFLGPTGTNPVANQPQIC